MKTFLVVAIDGSDLTSKEIALAFPHNHVLIEDKAWIIASEIYDTPEGVCTALGIYPPTSPPHNRTGLVTVLHHRAGMVRQSMLDALSYWENV